jgi:hypothetical protein
MFIGLLSCRLLTKVIDSTPDEWNDQEKEKESTELFGDSFPIGALLETTRIHDTLILKTKNHSSFSGKLYVVVSG